jgi:hypothetical protein
LTFDESNGSQEEQVDELCVGKEVPAGKAIRRMAIGEIKPQEEDDEDCMIEDAAALPLAAHPGESGQNPETPGFPETPEISPKTPDLLLKLHKVVKKLRI